MYENGRGRMLIKELQNFSFIHFYFLAIFYINIFAYHHQLVT